FEGMSIDLPWPTRVLIAMSDFFQNYTLVLVALTALVIFAVRLYGTTAKGGIALAKMQLGMPVIGSVVRMSNASQFAHT
ncbi:type II secretion system F family protein, partial [Klebsiella oxytoca]